MPEKEAAAHFDAAQYDEKTIESITPPTIVENDAKDSPASPVVDVMEQTEQHDHSTSSSPLERWNEPRGNIYRYFATLYSFIIMGMNDAATGVSIPGPLDSPTS